MIKRKFITLLLLVSILITCLPGCAKVVKTETTVVEATVIDTHYRGMWLQPVICGKVTTFITHPAKHNVKLQYKDYETTVNNKDLYDQYKDNIGAIVECNLVTTYYDDGTSETKLEWENDND